MSSSALFYPLPYSDAINQQQALNQMQSANAGNGSIIAQNQTANQNQHAFHGPNTSHSLHDNNSLIQQQDPNLFHHQLSGDHSLTLQNPGADQIQYGHLMGGGSNFPINQAQNVNQNQSANAGDGSIIVQNQNANQNQHAVHGPNTSHSLHDNTSLIPQQNQDLFQHQLSNVGDHSFALQNQGADQIQYGHLMGGGSNGWNSFPINQAQNANQNQSANAGDGSVIMQNQDLNQNQFANNNLFHGTRHMNELNGTTVNNNDDMFSWMGQFDPNQHNTSTTSVNPNDGTTMHILPMHDNNHSDWSTVTSSNVHHDGSGMATMHLDGSQMVDPVTVTYLN